jgi:hypothetical protein
MAQNVLNNTKENPDNAGLCLTDVDLTDVGLNNVTAIFML